MRRGGHRTTGGEGFNLGTGGEEYNEKGLVLEGIETRAENVITILSGVWRPMRLYETTSLIEIEH